MIRLDHVLRQPVDELVRLLGLEVPVAPILSLLDITTDSISIHWRVPEKKADVKYIVLVNGISGECSYTTHRRCGGKTDIVIIQLATLPRKTRP